MQNKTQNQILREQFQSEKKTSIDPSAVYQMIGLMGNIAANTIILDIDEMISLEKRKELDGYVFALSRIMRHEAAWEYITEGFSRKKETVPERYAPYFGQSAKNTKPVGRVAE